MEKINFIKEKCGGGELHHILNHLPPFEFFKLRNGSGVLAYIHCQMENGKELGRTYWNLEKSIEGQDKTVIDDITNLLNRKKVKTKY